MNWLRWIPAVRRRLERRERQADWQEEWRRFLRLTGPAWLTHDPSRQSTIDRDPLPSERA